MISEDIKNMYHINIVLLHTQEDLEDLLADNWPTYLHCEHILVFKGNSQSFIVLTSGCC